MIDWLATRLGAFAADSAGNVRRPSPLFNHAARACLLIDLGLASRITHYLAGTEIDTTVVGFAPADQLLAYVDQNPQGSMEQVIKHSPVSLLDVLAATYPPRYKRRFFSTPVELPLDYVAVQRDAVQRAIAGDIDDAGTAALTAVLRAMEVVVGETPATLVARCGDVAWLVGDLVPYLQNMRERYAMVAAWGSTGG